MADESMELKDTCDDAVELDSAPRKRVLFSDEQGKPLEQVFYFEKDEEEYTDYYPEWRIRYLIYKELKRQRKKHTKSSKSKKKTRAKYLKPDYWPHGVRKLQRWTRYHETQEYRDVIQHINATVAQLSLEEEAQKG